MAEIPDEFRALTASWFTECLSEAGALDTAEVLSFAVEPLGPDAGFVSRLARVALKYDRSVAYAPRTLIVKISAADPRQREHGLNMSLYEREVRFYRDLASLLPVSTPRCFHADINLQTGEHILLLEDLGVSDGDKRAAGCTRLESELAISEIAKLHAACWGRMHEDHLAWVPDMAHMHDFDRMQEAFPGFWIRFLELLPHPLPESIVAIGERVGERLTYLGNALYHGSPQTLVHFDYQPGNLFFVQTEDDLRLAVIDWQLMTRGRGITDVAYLVGEHMNPGLRRNVEMKLLQLYHRELMVNGVRYYSFDQCVYEYRLALLLRLALLSFILTHLPFSDAQRALHTDTLLPRNIAAIQDMNAAECLR